MAEWKQVKIGEIAKHRKGSIIIKDDTEYKLCRVQLHRRGVVLREILRGAEIKTKKQQVCKTGDIVVAEMDAKFGGYGFINEDLDGAIVSSHYYLFELDPKQIHRDYFIVLIQSGMIQNQIEAKGSTNYSSIRAWEFLDYTIPLPDLKCQKEIAKRFLDCYNGKKELQMQGDHQLSLFKQLRQQILQEAIEGKLTAEWRKKHPELISGENHASKLLEKIKAEKEKLIKEGKIKKDKPLSSITEAEKLFALPNGWVWCRLGDITNYGSSPKAKSSDLNSDTWVLDLEDIEKETSKLLYKIRFSERNSLSTKSIFKKGDVLYSKLRPYLDKVIVADENGVCTTEILPLRCFAQLNPNYLRWSLKRNDFLKYVNSVTRGMKMPRLGTVEGKLSLIPLPPLAEQQAIIERINKLMAMIDNLEKQVTERKEQSEMLMQSVLIEAFSLNDVRCS